MKNFIKLIVIICGFAFMCGMSSCCTLMDIYGPPPPRHHHCPPPPPRHHHHHYRYLVNTENEMSGEYDLAITTISDEHSCSVL